MDNPQRERGTRGNVGDEVARQARGGGVVAQSIRI